MHDEELGLDDRPGWLVFVVVAVVYGLLALSAYELFGALSIGVTFFPPAGFTFAAFLLLPRRSWPAVAAGIVVGELVVDLGQGQGFWWSMGWGVANLVEPLVGAGLVVRTFAPPVQLSRRFAGWFLLGGLLLGPACGAAIGAAVLSVSGDLGWWESFPDIWVGDALGVLVVAPFVMVLLRPRAIGAGRTSWTSVVVVLVLTAIAGLVLFVADSVPIGYAVIPLLAVPAVRYGTRELALASVVIAALVTAATARGRGPWASMEGGDGQAELVQQQVFLLVAIAGAWLLKLEVAERVVAVARVQRTEAQLQTARDQARDQRYLAAMQDALGDLAAAARSIEVAGAVADHARRLFGAVSTALLLARDGDDLEVVAVDGPSPLGLEQGHRIPLGADRAVARVARTGRPALPPDDGGTIDLTAPGVALPPDTAVLPLTVGGGVRGALALTRPASQPWTVRAQVRALAFASVVGDALERTERSELDRDIALTLQQALMPEAVPDVAGAAAAGRYLPATQALEIGGDWFEVVPGDDLRPSVAIIGDVVGHSLDAAAAMGKLAAAARALAHAGHPPAELLGYLDLVAAHTPGALMTTVACAAWDPGTRCLRYACAGHPAPLVRRPDGTVVDLDDGRGAPLAVALDRARAEAVAALPAGALVLFYTDGLVERRDRPIDDGLEQLRRVLADAPSHDPDQVCDHVVADLVGSGHEDDVALLCLAVDEPAADRTATVR